MFAEHLHEFNRWEVFFGTFFGRQYEHIKHEFHVFLNSDPYRRSADNIQRKQFLNFLNF